jgi:hypothetical protein
MPTFSEILPPTKSDRHPGILWTPGVFPGTGKLVIQGDHSYVAYAVAEMPTEWRGTAARLMKFADTPGSDGGSESYEVFCAAPGSREADQCSCKGFAYGKGKPCKHIEAVKALVANNWLSRAELANPEQDVSNTEVS